MINESTNTNNDITKRLYFNSISKDELESELDFDSLKKHGHPIIKNFGNEYYRELEKTLILKKINEDKVPIDYFKLRFNVNFLMGYKDIIVNAYGQDEYDNWFSQYK